MNEAEKGLENFKNFASIIKRIFVEEKVNFNLIIAAGDSGLIMSKFTKMILDEIGVKHPNFLVLPIFRFTKKHVPSGDYFDNSILVEDVLNKIDQKLDNILFIDDEINRARTLNAMIDIIKSGNPEAISENTILYILAEDRGFTKDLVNGLRVNYIPFGIKTEGLNNVILKMVPDEIKVKLEKEYGQFYATDLNCILLDLPVKELIGDKPHWSYDLLNDVKSKVPNLDFYQNEFEDYIKNLIKKNI